MREFIPKRFHHFLDCFDFLLSKNPKSIAFAGSYGNQLKRPDGLSDLDIILVYETTNVLCILREWIVHLSHQVTFSCIYLGVHPQFGHLVNLSDSADPLLWIDVGIMDEVFAKNYLTDLPIRVLRGSIKTSGLRSNPESHMAHLLRKAIKARQRNSNLAASSYCYRYLHWRQLLSPQDDDDTKGLELVLKDAKQRFPEMCKKMRID